MIAIIMIANIMIANIMIANIMIRYVYFSPGGFKNIDVLVTQDGDVIFRLNLMALTNAPVHLLRCLRRC